MKKPFQAADERGSTPITFPIRVHPRSSAAHSFCALDERRFVTFGVSSSGRLLVVAHAQQDDVIRIITARLATRAERKLYAEG
jgi:uncharacterized DUF497 family protein